MKPINECHNCPPRIMSERDHYSYSQKQIVAGVIKVAKRSRTDFSLLIIEILPELSENQLFMMQKYISRLLSECAPERKLKNRQISHKPWRRDVY